MTKERGISKVRIQWSRVTLVVVLAFFLVEASLAFERKLVLHQEVHEHLLKARAELAWLQNQNLALKEEKEALHHPEKIEQLAREKLGLTKPHEIAVKIIRKASDDRTHEQGNPPKPSKGLWEKIKEELPIQWLLKSGRS